MPTTWISRDLWECEDCGAILGVAKIKVQTMKMEKTIREKTNNAFSEQTEVKDGN